MAKKETTSTEIAEKQNTSLVVTDQYEQYAGSGFENQDSTDYKVPFISLLQALSPMVVDGARDDARPGKFHNPITDEILDGKVGIRFIPCLTKHEFVEYKPNRGGFVAAHDPSSEVVRHAKETGGFNGLKVGENDLTETYYVFGLIVDDDDTGYEVCMSFSSTKIKKYRMWMTKARSIQMTRANGTRFPAPLYAHMFRITAVSDKGQKGQFFNLDATWVNKTAIESRLPVDSDLFVQADGFKRLLESGNAKVDYSADQATGETTGVNVNKDTGEVF